jgi:hypothetical protein
MKFTPEQETQFERERRENPDKTSFIFDPTPEQEAELEAAAQLELDHKDETIAWLRRHEELLAEDSFLGSLRRALDASKKSWADLERTSEVPAARIEQFFMGDADLTQNDIDRLVRTLGLQLVPANSIH